MVKLHPKLLLENSTVHERKRAFKQAYTLARIEYGSLDDRSKQSMEEYIYGEKELLQVEQQELKRLRQEYEEENTRMPYWDNKLKIKNKRYLKRACSSIVTIEIMKLDAEPVESFDWEYYKTIHRRLYKHLFEWAGETRNVNYKQRQEALQWEIFQFTEFHAIESSVLKVFKQVEKLIDRANIEVALSAVFERLGVTDWQAMPDSQKCTELLLCIGKVWEIHPFLHGNMMAELYFIVKFSQEYGFTCQRQTLLEYSQENKLRRSVIFAFYDPNWLGRIMMLAITREKNEHLRKQQDNLLGEKKMSLAQMNQVVQDGKNKIIQQQKQQENEEES